jgi:nitrogen regulatory protein PII
VIKVVVAYVDQDAFRAIREDLNQHGFRSFSVIDAGGVTPDQFVAPHFRGTPHTQGLQGKLRLEIVVGEGQVDEIKQIVFRHETKRSFLFVMDVEQAFPEDLVLGD